MENIFLEENRTILSEKNFLTKTKDDCSRKKNKLQIMSLLANEKAFFEEK